MEELPDVRIDINKGAPTEQKAIEECLEVTAEGLLELSKQLKARTETGSRLSCKDLEMLADAFDHLVSATGNLLIPLQ